MSEEETLERALDRIRYCICASVYMVTTDGLLTNSSTVGDDGLRPSSMSSVLSSLGTAAASSLWEATTAISGGENVASRGAEEVGNDPCSDLSLAFDIPSPSTNENFRRIEEMLKSRVAVAVCVFGLIGNVGNLIVLLPQGRHCSMGRIERFAYCGLVALTISDGLFCLSVIPQAFVEPTAVVNRRDDFRLLYAVYGDALCNVFSMASTWLTVTLAVGRYLAICHPFRAREVIGTTVAKRAIFVVYVACILFNVPRFLTHGVEKISCDIAGDDDDDDVDGGGGAGTSESLYFQWPGETHVKRRPDLERLYMWLYFVLGIGVPFVCLVFSNVFLVRALRGARVRLQSIRAVDVYQHQYRPITLTLVVLVIMHILLVSPAEFALFLRQLLARIGLPNNESYLSDDWYNLITAICNTMQAVNFSINFVLYYTINVHFRRAVARLLRCRLASKLPSTPARRGFLGGGIIGIEGTGMGAGDCAMGHSSITLHTYTTSRRGHHSIESTH